MSIKDKLKDDRPREKLQQKGATALSDYELLMAIIGSGNKYADVTKIAKNVQKLLKEKGSELTFDDLLTVKSLGPAKATQIMSGFELWRRQFEVTERPIVDSPEKAAALLKDIRDKKQEHFVVMTLDGANRLIAKRTVTIGTLTSSLVHPREVFADAITDRAASIIVDHNHPSGNLEPSKADLDITARLYSASMILGVHLNSHILVTPNSHTIISPGNKS